jgi:hypothetical protein
VAVPVGAADAPVHARRDHLPGPRRDVGFLARSGDRAAPCSPRGLVSCWTTMLVMVSLR